MAFSLPKLGSDPEPSIQEQLATLRREMAELTRSLSKSGAQTARDTREGAYELYDDLSERFTAALPGLRKQAHHATKVIRDHPTAATATVGLVVAGLMVALFVSRRSED